MSKNKKLVSFKTDSGFLDFLNRKFDETAQAATVEELAEFAFGSLKAGVGAFRKRAKEHETKERG